MAEMNSPLVTAVTGVPSSTRPTRSLVMMPAPKVSKQAASSLSAKADRSGVPSSWPRLRSAPDQAKMVAMGLVEVCSPFRCL